MDECEVPRAMVVEILSRLPPKSLMRFKCIHKSWNSLINNAHFVSKHLHFHNNVSSSTNILLKRRVIRATESRDEEIVCTLLTLRNENNCAEDNIYYDIEDIQFPPSIGLKSRGQFIEIPRHCSYDCAYIVGHCDGIFCLTLDTASNLVLYNPAIKEAKLIPGSCLRDKFIGAVGFGYDPNSEDYILVSVARYGEEAYNDRIVINPLRAEMYTLGTDSWREIKIHNLETETTFFWPAHFQVYFKGNCYWLAYENQKEFISYLDRLEEQYIRDVIVSFDTGNQVFRTILVPDCLYEFPTHEFYLTVLWNESVGLFGFYRGGNKPFEIWVMDDSDCVNSSWIKHRSIDVVEPAIPLALWEENEILLVSTWTQVTLYNFVTEKYMYLPLYGALYFEAFPYEPSLVPLKR